MNRAQLPDEVFGIPQERKYPMPDRRHTISAIKLFNHVEDKYEEQLAKAIIKNMKKYDIDSSMIGDNNRLKKYIPKDMVTESSRIRYISLSKKERSDIITITKSLKDPWKKEFDDIYLEKIVYKKIKYYSGIPIGFVIIRAITKDNENRGSITVAISPNHEGKNLGYTLVKEAIAFYDKCSFLDSIEYRVAKNNKRSISLVDRLGFTYISDKDNYMIYRLSKDMISESSTANFEFLDITKNKQKALSYFNSVGKNYDKYIDLYSGEIIIDKKSDKVIGSVLVGNKKDKGFITDLWVDKKYQGQGLGSRLLKDAINKYGGVDLTVKKDNDIAIHMYKKYGFVPIEYNNEKYYWMKLKNKLSKDDKILQEADLCNEYVQENFIINKKDMCVNVDKFEKGETNVLLVTGLSGSGKSTLADQLASKYRATHYELDCLSFYLGKHMSLEDAKGNEDALVDFINKKKLDQIKPSQDKYLQLYREYIKFIINWCKKRKDVKFVIEGLQIYETYENGDSHITSCPIIIKGTSALISSIRGAKRNVDGLNFLGEFKDLLIWALKDNKKLSQLRKDISENYLLEDADKIKNIIFDLGNVLVSTNMEDLMAVDPDIPNDKINYIMSQWYKDEDDPIGLDEFKSIIPARLKEASKFIPKLFEYNIRCVNPFDYTIPLIDKLKADGYNVYFLSNWSKWSYELLDRYHKFDFLEKMNGGVWSWQTGCMKPNERIYRILLNKYNLNPEECVFFDDLKDNVEAANGVGIKGFLFDRLDFDIDNFFGKNIYGIVEESGILDDGGKRNVNKNTNPYNSKKVSKSITSTAFKLSLKHLFDKKASDQYEWVRNEYIPKIIDKCKTDADIKYMRDDSYIAQQQMLTLLRNIEAVENNDTAKMKRLSKSFIKKVQSGKINSKDVKRHYNWLRGEGRQLLNKKAKEIRNSIKESTTAGTVVGSNQADSIYIVNYMQNNVFSGHKENRLGICKKGMKDLHTFGGKYDRFHYVSDLDEFKEEASDIKMYRYTGTPKNSFYEIIEDTVNDFDLYKLLTGRDLPDRSFIDYDSEFIQEECFLDTLDAIRECTEAGLLSLTENKYPVPILTETVQGRPYNYYRDLDGVFIQHEVTKIRSKSYRDKNSIPEAQVNAVKRGYLY